MISKEVRVVADYLVEFYANPTTVAVFASSLCWAMREMNMYCFDQEMKRGTYDSGLPEGYESWAFENLKELVKIPIYKKRIEEHLSQLDLSISNREKELNQTYLAEELAKMKTRKELIESVL